MYSITFYTQTFATEFLSSICRKGQNLGQKKEKAFSTSLVSISPMFLSHKGTVYFTAVSKISLHPG